MYFNIVMFTMSPNESTSAVVFVFINYGIWKVAEDMEVYPLENHALCITDFPWWKHKLTSFIWRQQQTHGNHWILTFWVTMRNRRALNWGMVGVTPGILAGSEWGESSTVLGFTIFSTSINQASRNSPVPSGRSVCSSPSDTGTFPPIDRAQLNVLKKATQQISS